MINAPQPDDEHYPASVLPQPQEVHQVDPSFSPVGSLQIPNAVKTADGMSDSTFLNTLVPLASKASPMTRASADAAQEVAR